MSRSQGGHSGCRLKVLDQRNMHSKQTLKKKTWLVRNMAQVCGSPYRQTDKRQHRSKIVHPRSVVLGA